jgi:hypothetical protein
MLLSSPFTRLQGAQAPLKHGDLSSADCRKRLSILGQKLTGRQTLDQSCKCGRGIGYRVNFRQPELERSSLKRRTAVIGGRN